MIIITKIIKQIIDNDNDNDYYYCLIMDELNISPKIISSSTFSFKNL